MHAAVGKHHNDHVLALILDQGEERLLQDGFGVVGCVCDCGARWVYVKIGSVGGGKG